MQAGIDAGDFIESAEYNNNLYGTRLVSGLNIKNLEYAQQYLYYLRSLSMVECIKLF